MFDRLFSISFKEFFNIYFRFQKIQYLCGFRDLITYLPLHNYVLAIAQLRTCHCTITYFAVDKYVIRRYTLL